MKTTLSVITALVLTLMLSGCETWQGLGRDVRGLNRWGCWCGCDYATQHKAAQVATPKKAPQVSDTEESLADSDTEEGRAGEGYTRTSTT